MDLKLNNVVVGKFYCNIQIDRASLSEPYTDFILKLREGKVVLDYENVKMTIKSYRKYYADEDRLYIEGSELSFE